MRWNIILRVFATILLLPLTACNPKDNFDALNTPPGAKASIIEHINTSLQAQLDAQAATSGNANHVYPN